MTKFRRLKRSFTAGEVGPLIAGVRTDNDRFKNGCKSLLNMISKSQGPATRRSGFQFIYDLTAELNAVITDSSVKPRMVPFIFDETEACVLIYFQYSTGSTRVIFATEEGIVEDDDNPGSAYVFEFSGTMDIDNFDYAQSGDLIYHVQPTRTLVEFRRTTTNNWAATETTFRDQPFVQNLIAGFTVKPSGTTGSITLLASADLFTSAFEDTEMKLNGGRATITAVTDETHATATVTTTLTSTTALDTWQTPGWGPVQGYPRLVGFFEQRICFASNTARPQTLWFSKAGDYVDFGQSSPIVASDACTFTFDSATQNKIQWINSARQLIIGTMGDEWTLSGNGNDPLSFVSVRASRQSNTGSERIKSLMVGAVTLFVERLGRKMLQFVYDYNSDSYASVDLSVLAPHLTDEYSIVNWTYSQTPNGIVYAVREDGVLLGLTLKREHNVTGWHRHTTDGKFIEVACIPGQNRETELWAIIEREIGGVKKWYIEKQAPEFRADTSEAGYFLDSYLVYDGAETDVLTGLEHLEGKLVSILANGAVHAKKQVTGGRIALDYPVTFATVGLPYLSELRPVFSEVDFQDGTAFGKVQKTAEVIVFVDKSVGFQIGRVNEDGEDLYEDVPVRTPAMETGVAVPLYSGPVQIDFMEGWTRDPDIFIRQVEPLPLTVLGLVDVVDISGE